MTVGLIGLRFEVVRAGELNVLRTARRNLDAPRLLMGRPTPYVGRERELRLLDEVLDECIDDRVSRCVLVTGQPGIGKSRLAGEWLARGGRMVADSSATQRDGPEAPLFRKTRMS